LPDALIGYRKFS